MKQASNIFPLRMIWVSLQTTRFKALVAQAKRGRVGMVSFGLNMFTGDPGDPEHRVKPIDPITGKRTYVKNILGNDPDEFRSGVVYFGVLNLRVGIDSESIRSYIQNEKIHRDKYPWFKKLPEIKDRFYFGIITEIGSW